MNSGKSKKAQKGPEEAGQGDEGVEATDQAVDEPPDEKIDSVRVNKFLDDHDGVRMGTEWAVSGRTRQGRETRVPFGGREEVSVEPFWGQW